MVPLFAPLFALGPGQEGRKGGDGGAAGTQWDLWAQVVPTASNSGCVVVEIPQPARKSLDICLGSREQHGRVPSALLPLSQSAGLSMINGILNDQ